MMKPPAFLNPVIVDDRLPVSDQEWRLHLEEGSWLVRRSAWEKQKEKNDEG